ncbi:MAG: hypothetical protein Q9157_003876 [Trypethelium eluteriae]
MIENHHSSSKGVSEFSSWFTSLLAGLFFARNLAKYDAHLCCLDTAKLPQDRRVYPNQALVENGIVSIKNGLTELECLAHGTIEQQCFVSVRYQDLVAAGILLFLPSPDECENSAYSESERAYLWSQPSRRLTLEEVDTAFRVGVLFGVGKTLPIALSLLTLRPRQEKDGNGKSVFFQEDIALIVDAIHQHSLPVPNKWLDDFIEVPDPFSLHKGTPEVEQMIYLIRTILAEAFAEQEPERNFHLFKEEFTKLPRKSISVSKIAGSAVRKLSTLNFRPEKKGLINP